MVATLLCTSCVPYVSIMACVTFVQKWLFSINLFIVQFGCESVTFISSDAVFIIGAIYLAIASVLDQILK